MVNRREKKKIFRGIGKGPEKKERETDWTGTGLEGRIKNKERSRRCVWWGGAWEERGESIVEALRCVPSTCE